MIKYKQNCDINDSYFFEYKGELVLGEVKVKIQEFKFDEYPFVDTLSYLNDGYISNISSAGSEQMHDTDGTISMCFSCDGSGVESVNCEECDGVGSNECEKCDGSGKKEDDSDKNCKKCDGEGFIECKECNGDGDIQGDCTECVGMYKITLKDILEHHKDPKIKDLASKELARIKSEKKDKKNKK
jgi:DnaJ-class molecular chaperone